jgi:four helix bundle protein
MINSYRDLEAWQSAMELWEETYRVTRTYPRSELFGLTSQTQRAVVSIASNIAEGHARGTPREFMHFLLIARGSLAELETQFLGAIRLGYLDRDTLRPIWYRCQRTGMLINGLLRALRSKDK